MYMNRKIKKIKYHAEEMFINNNNQDDLKSIPVLWINNSPCPACAQRLINAYQGLHKPMIFIAHFYIGKNKQREVSLRCLARMVSEGFTLEPFKWGLYQYLLSKDVCKDAITRALDDEDFVSEMKDMEDTLDLVYEYKKNGNINCP